MTEYIARKAERLLRRFRTGFRPSQIWTKRPALTYSETARLERCLLEQASNSLSRMTIHYCDYVETYMDAAPPSEERLEAVQQGIKTLNHISVTLERLRRALQETAPAETKD